MIVTGLMVLWALAQENTGSVPGLVIDSVTRRPVSNAEVSLVPGTPDQRVVTDAAGEFELSQVQPGERRVMVRHRDYGQGIMLKRVVVTPGQRTTTLTFELIPSGSISGRVLDEDGDPLDGCSVQPRQDGTAMAILDRMGPVSMRGATSASAWRLFGLKQGTYLLVARCALPVFEPRPLSRGPDPLPAKAYAPQLSEPVVVAPGAETAGVDFRMHPAAVTGIHVTFAPGEDWQGRKDLGWQLIAADRELTLGTLGTWHPIDTAKGGFEIPRVFAGSYTLLVTARVENEARLIGAVQPVTVGDKPVEMTVRMRRAMDLNGRVEFENSGGRTMLSPSQVRIQLMPEYPYLNTGVAPARVEEDGTFVIKSAFPGPSRLDLFAKDAFLKAAWIGGEPVIDGLVDVSNGPRGDLRVVVSTNTATLQGTAEPGLTVWASPVSATGFRYEKRGGQSDAAGTFRIEGLAPGTYRVAATEMDNSPQGNSQEVSVGEGETKTVALK